ncbi:hypothetical protein HDU93_000259, partial [Gonapodya sp. JEL0774]
MTCTLPLPPLLPPSGDLLFTGIPSASNVSDPAKDPVVAVSGVVTPGAHFVRPPVDGDGVAGGAAVGGGLGSGGAGGAGAGPDTAGSGGPALPPLLTLAHAQFYLPPVLPSPLATPPSPPRVLPLPSSSLPASTCLILLVSLAKPGVAEAASDVTATKIFSVPAFERVDDLVEGTATGSGSGWGGGYGTVLAVPDNTSAAAITTAPAIPYHLVSHL